MPLEQLLALYGYNMPDPVLQQQQEPNELAASLPEMTPDKVTITEIIKVSVKSNHLRLSILFIIKSGCDRLELQCARLPVSFT